MRPPAGLLAQIRASPSDTVAWRVLEDWLLAHGDARGLMLRIERRLAEPGLSDPVHLVLRQTQQDLYVPLRAALRLPEGVGARWHGGFVVQLWFDSAGCAAEQLPALLSAPELPLLCGIGISTPRLEARGAEILAGLGRLSGLYTLELQHSGLDPHDLEILAEAGFLASFSSLDLSRNALGARGAECLARPGVLSDPLSLNLNLTGIGDAGAVALARAPSLGSLVHLFLKRCELSPRGASTLVGSTHLAGLTALDLGQNDLGARESQRWDSPRRGAEHGVHSWLPSPEAPALGALRSLELTCSGLDDDDLAHLVRAPWVRGLERLFLALNAITDAGVAALLAQPLPHLSELELRDNRVGTDGALALLRSSALPELTSLNLKDNQIEGELVAALEDTQPPPRLRWLDLAGNFLDLDACAALGRISQQWQVRMRVPHEG